MLPTPGGLDRHYLQHAFHTLCLLRRFVWKTRIHAVLSSLTPHIPPYADNLDGKAPSDATGAC